MYECVLCQRSFSRKATLDYHMDHNVCRKPDEKVCPLCHKQFTSKQMCQYHITHKVCDKSTHSSPIKPQLILKKTHREELNPQVIVPPAFLEVDNYEQITAQLPNLLHTTVSKHPSDCISYLIQETNGNPNQPLFNSVMITNKKDPIVRISDGHKFIYASKKSIITRLIENKKDILKKYVGENGDRYGEELLNEYRNYVDSLDSDKETQKDLEIEIMCMLLNVSEVIGSEEWSSKLGGM
jgi:hypothetical protein